MAGKKKAKGKASRGTRESAAKPRVALYGLDAGTPKGDAVRSVLGRLAIPTFNINPEWMGSPVGAIAGMPGFKVSKAPFDGMVPDEEFMLLCNLEYKQTNELLAAMRDAGCPVGCKAQVTQFNRLWPIGHLIGEVCREHHAMTDGRSLPEE